MTKRKPTSAEIIKATSELQKKIALVKKNGTWEGVDADEYMRMARGEKS